MKDLAAAIAQLYATFASQPLDPPVAGCDCCVDAPDIDAVAELRHADWADELADCSYHLGSLAALRPG